MTANIYAIGDVQGCYDELQLLLEKIHFNPEQDQLWFVGDLVNRGPKSLETLRFIKSLGHAAICTLGNHDMFLMAAYHGFITPGSNATIQDILQADDAEVLIMWLSKQPLLYQAHDYIMVHAGIPPQWDRHQAQRYADELSRVLQSDKYFLKVMYGDQPDIWSDDLQGYERMRYITNAFTRMRYCHPNGALDLSFAGPLAKYTGDAQPWFMLENRKTKQDNILFGHWAALRGKADAEHVFALDTGCAWGESLTAMRLSDRKIFQVQANNAQA